MTKTKIIAEVAKKSNLTQKQTEAAFNAFVELLTDSLYAGEKVQISGFGTFEAKERGEHDTRNPFTGEMMHVGPSRRVSFTPGKALKEKFKG